MLKTRRIIPCTLAALLAAAGGAEAADRPAWITLSSKTGDLPAPGTSIW
jgi:hypothetical protein